MLERPGPVFRRTRIRSAKDRRAQEDTVPKKTNKAPGGRGRARRRPSKSKDLPVDRKARTVKGGAFSAALGDGSVRNTLGGIRNTV
jgi:hypothetical protein